MRYYKVLLFCYWFGIPTALFCALTGNLNQPLLQVFRIIPDLSSYLFAFSVSHMLVVIFIGFQVDTNLRGIAGAKIQTAGYLHTLIGFSSALFHITPDAFSIYSIMIPLGAALTTSILGWFFGGEIADSGPRNDGNPLVGEIENIRKELDGFSRTLVEIHESYLRTLKTVNQSLEDVRASQQKNVVLLTTTTSNLAAATMPLLEAAEELHKSVSSASEVTHKQLGKSFIETIESISKNAKRAATELGNTANSAKDVANYLQQSKLLIQALEELMESISKERR